MFLLFHFIFTYIYVFLLLYGMCLMFSLGYYVTIYVLLTYVHGGYFMYFDKVSCFSLALGLDQMI